MAADRDPHRRRRSCLTPRTAGAAAQADADRREACRPQRVFVARPLELRQIARLADRALLHFPIEASLPLLRLRRPPTLLRHLRLELPAQILLLPLHPTRPLAPSPAPSLGNRLCSSTATGRRRTRPTWCESGTGSGSTPRGPPRRHFEGVSAAGLHRRHARRLPVQVTQRGVRGRPRWCVVLRFAGAPREGAPKLRHQCLFSSSRSGLGCVRAFFSRVPRSPSHQ